MRRLTRPGIGALLALGGFSAACGGSTEPKSVPAPTLEARRGHSMAYDEARHATILFGGWGTEDGAAASDRASTWSWNGTSWSRLATSGPSARHDASMVYDASRQRVVLYGGRSGSFPNEVLLTDTWEWNGASWSKAADSGPSSRVHQHMAYDRARSRTVLYGGFDVAAQAELRDIWEWNGATWSKANVSGPANSVAAGVAYEEGASLSLLFSLDNASNRIVVDAWNGSALARTTVPSPSCVPIADPTLSLGGIRGILWFGYCAASTAEIHLSLVGSSWTTLSGALPSIRGSTALAYDRDRQRVVLFGGEALPTGTPLLGDTWEFDGTAWSRK